MPVAEVLPSDDIGVSLSSDQVDQINQVLALAPFTDFTHYVVMGDEPPDFILAVDMSAYIDATTLADIKANFRLLPRQYLKPWFDKSIAPSLDPQYTLMVWKSVLNLFNSENLAEANARQIDPWAWEEFKIRDLYQTQASSEYQALVSSQLFDPMVILEQARQYRINQILTSFASLPKLADLNLEVRRQAALKGLIDQGFLDDAANLVLQYQMLDDQSLAVLTTVTNLSEAANPSPQSVIILDQSNPTLVSSTPADQTTVANVVAPLQTDIGVNKLQNPMLVFFN